jgi:hypothetical protein
MQSKLITILILLLVTSLIASSVFSEGSAVPQTDQVTISWITSSENNIKSFKVLRSHDSEFFIEIENVNPKGPGTAYEVIDENVMFKSSKVIFYKVRALDKSNRIIEELSLPAQTELSDIKQTWGAIKAMFD